MDIIRHIITAENMFVGVAMEGHPLKAWRWLMAMTEHEIHQRSQIAVYSFSTDPHLWPGGGRFNFALSELIKEKIL